MFETETSAPVTVEYLGNTHEFEVNASEAATCTVAGYIKYLCYCGETRTEILKARGHSIVTTVEAEATCTTDGLIVDRCVADGCDYEKRIIGEWNNSKRMIARAKIKGVFKWMERVMKNRFSSILRKINKRMNGKIFLQML